MTVTIIGKDGLLRRALPEKTAGRYWLFAPGKETAAPISSVDGTAEGWRLLSGASARIISEDGSPLRSALLRPFEVHALQKKSGERFYVYAEPAGSGRQCFTKYLIPEGFVLRIGRRKENDICCSLPVISGTHAEISRKDGSFFLRDMNSRNGTYVNGARVTDCTLRPGDCIDIPGMRLIAGKDFLAVNNPDHAVSVRPPLEVFLPCADDLGKVPEEEDGEEEAEEVMYFYRSPRFRREIETLKLSVDPPPPSPVREELPWPLVMGSSLSMGMMSAVMLYNAVMTKNRLSMIMGAAMLFGTLVLPLTTKIYERLRRRRKERLRQEKYREYLEGISLKILEAEALQEKILSENLIETAECEKRILERSPALFERSMDQRDFLTVRIGLGDTPLQAEISAQEPRFTVEKDLLQEEMTALLRRPRLLRQVPLGLCLTDDPMTGIIGERREVLPFAQGLIIQLAALYGYDELEMVFLYDPPDGEALEFTKWLPHGFAEENGIRLIAADQNEGKEISAYLLQVLRERRAIPEHEIRHTKPYIVIFSFSRTLSRQNEAVREILAAGQQLNISVISIFDEYRMLPRECTKVIELRNGAGKLYERSDVYGRGLDFVPDIFPENDPKKLAVKLANTFLPVNAGAQLLPKQLGFLQMYGVSQAEHLNVTARWHENDPAKSLQVPIGADPSGEPFMLDLHEKYHGPHGLAAGMTGSGKSEFIMTLILSLSVNFSPEEAAFVLIDYKGGGMAKAFENLPHTAGVITNLDGSAVRRSLVSIESELRRRQRILAAAGKAQRISNMDIYAYQRLFREGRVTEPLPHLFIISDEFAELKTQQPEFMAQLVSAARIGRSLGIHLILATQKPSGVVDDQIWSNSKFRICFRVQERADSIEMLRRPDAAELRETGRFYLQVGYNELFLVGQGAYSGAPYTPSAAVRPEKDERLLVIDRTGRTIREVRPVGKDTSDGRRQLEVITAYLRRCAAEEGLRARPLWLPVMPPAPGLLALQKKYPKKPAPFVLEPLVGEFDDPEEQKQGDLRLLLSAEGNAAVYGAAGSGKTSFLNAMAVSLILEHEPEEVNLYLLDFSGETLQAFESAPHVGGVVLPNEEEKLQNLFKMLQKEAARRKKLFADLGGDIASFIRRSKERLPYLIVVIHGFPVFTESFPEREEDVFRLSREGKKLGICFVLTSTETGGIRLRLLQNFRQIFVLQLNDPSDYSALVGRTEGLFPAKHKGRGLFRREKLLEFQTAAIAEEAERSETIRAICAQRSQNYKGKRAQRIPVLPKNVDIDFLYAGLQKTRFLRLPVGVEKESLSVKCAPFDRHFINLILSAEDDYLNFFGKLSEMISTRVPAELLLLDPGQLLQGKGLPARISLRSDCEEAVSALFLEVLQRNNVSKEALSKKQEVPDFQELVVMISSLFALRAGLSAEGAEKLGLILERGRKEYHLHLFIGEKLRNLEAMRYEKWFQNACTGADGLWVGGRFTEQYLLKPSVTTAELRRNTGPESGILLEKGKPVLLRLLSDREKEAEDE